jgi:hypothetical protein
MRRTRPLAYPIRNRLAALLLALGASAGARGGDGLEALQQVTHDACDCAAGQMSGLDAALRCTDGLQDFGRLKVAHRGAWDPAGARHAAELERVIETCIANAMSDSDARDLLGLPPLAVAGPAPLVRWKRVPPQTLARHPTRLVRISRGGGVTLKGLVENAGDGSVVLRRARMDGGGRQRIPLAEIRGAWVMELPAP